MKWLVKGIVDSPRYSVYAEMCGLRSMEPELGWGGPVERSRL